MLRTAAPRGAPGGFSEYRSRGAARLAGSFEPMLTLLENPFQSFTFAGLGNFPFDGCSMVQPCGARQKLIFRDKPDLPRRDFSK
jgi:hypothetical protein